MFTFDELMSKIRSYEPVVERLVWYGGAEVSWCIGDKYHLTRLWKMEHLRASLLTDLTSYDAYRYLVDITDDKKIIDEIITYISKDALIYAHHPGLLTLMILSNRNDTYTIIRYMIEHDESLLFYDMDPILDTQSQDIMKRRLTTAIGRAITCIDDKNLHADVLRWHAKHKNAHWYRIPYIVEEFFRDVYTQPYRHLDMVSDRVITASIILDVYVYTTESIRNLYSVQGLTYIGYLYIAGRDNSLRNIVELIRRWSIEDGFRRELMHIVDVHDDIGNLYGVCSDLEEFNIYDDYTGYDS